MSAEAGDRPREFGRLIKAALLDRGWTQARLAQEVGVAPAWLSRVLGGGRPPSADLILRIATALGLSLEEQQRLLTAAGFGTSVPPQKPTASRRGRRRGPTHGAPLPVTLDDDKAELLLSILERLDGIDDEVRAIRDTVETLLQQEESSE